MAMLISNGALLPTLEDPAQEALQSLNMLHGSLIMATVEVRELEEQADQLQMTRAASGAPNRRSGHRRRASRCPRDIRAAGRQDCYPGRGSYRRRPASRTRHCLRYRDFHACNDCAYQRFSIGGASSNGTNPRWFSRRINRRWCHLDQVQGTGEHYYV